MLRYVEQLGLVEAPRSAAGYRLYGPAQVARLRSLRSLLDTHGLELGDVGFALRLRREPALSAALDEWFAGGAPARVDGPQRRDGSQHLDGPRHRPVPDAPGDDWLAFEQTKHQQLLTSDRQDIA